MWKTENSPPKIKNKAMVSVLINSIQHCTKWPHWYKARKKQKYKDWKWRNKTFIISEWQCLECGKS